MSRITLPDIGLVFVFGPIPPVLASCIVDSPAAATVRLAARGRAVVAASDLINAELQAYARSAAHAFARCYAIAVGPDADACAKRVDPLKVTTVFAVDTGWDGSIMCEPVSTDRRGERGPFDIIGDVHGCRDELLDLLLALGYRVSPTSAHAYDVTPPPGRRAIFVGDLVDRGPDSVGVLTIVMSMVASGSALCIAGNHDAALRHWLDGRATGAPSTRHGLAATLAAVEQQPARFKHDVLRFLGGLEGHLWLDGGALVVAHAGVREAMIGRATGPVRAFTLYGDTDPKPSADGLPTRYHWALDYRGATSIVYGHTPLDDVGWVNNTLCIDTGCCFGGALTALRWPERAVVGMPARAVHANRGRAFGHPPPRPQRHAS